LLIRRQLLAATGLALFAGGWHGRGASQAGDDAAQLAHAVHARPVGKDVSTRTRMELSDGGGAPRVRTLATYRQQRPGGEVANLIRFLAPADIAGTAFLGIDRADGKSDQWLYLPAMDRVRRVASDRKGGRFVGSEIYFEDLQDRQPHRDRHRLVGRETIAGVACEVLESVPADPTDSVYLKRLSWIDRGAAMALRVDYFERNAEEPSKRWTLVTRRRDKSYWTVVESRMTDLASGRETRMLAESVVYDRGLPTKLFTSQALADEALEMDHRPP
jgi:hypothetical protein